MNFLFAPKYYLWLTRKTLCKISKESYFCFQQIEKKMSSDKLLDLMKYVFPSELVDYFDIMDMHEISGTLHLYLEELNIVPQERVRLKKIIPQWFL